MARQSLLPPFQSRPSGWNVGCRVGLRKLPNCRQSSRNFGWRDCAIARAAGPRVMRDNSADPPTLRRQGLFPCEAEIARRLSQSEKRWRGIVRQLEREGLPKIDPLMGGRFWPAVVQRSIWHRRGCNAGQRNDLPSTARGRGTLGCPLRGTTPDSSSRRPEKTARPCPIGSRREERSRPGISRRRFDWMALSIPRQNFLPVATSYLTYAIDLIDWRLNAESK